MSKLNPGDKVTVTGNTSMHRFALGEVVTFAPYVPATMSALLLRLADEQRQMMLEDKLTPVEARAVLAVGDNVIQGIIEGVSDELVAICRWDERYAELVDRPRYVRIDRVDAAWLAMDA